MTLQAYLNSVGKDKNASTGEEVFKASIKLTKKQAEERNMPIVNLMIKSTDEQYLQDLLDEGKITIEIAQNT